MDCKLPVVRTPVTVAGLPGNELDQVDPSVVYSTVQPSGATTEPFTNPM